MMLDEIGNVGPEVSTTALPQFPAPNTNLSLIYGVPRNPLHSAHPEGIFVRAPCHIMIIHVRKENGVRLTCAENKYVPV